MSLLKCPCNVACFHGNVSSTSLQLLVVVKDEIRFNLACLRVHEDHKRDKKKNNTQNAQRHGLDLCSQDLSIFFCLIPRTVPVSSFILYRKLISCYTTFSSKAFRFDTFAKLKILLLALYLLNHLLAQQGYGISSFITALSTPFPMTYHPYNTSY